MRSRVVPGRSSTIATRSPTSRLKSVDFPTLGRPTIAAVAFAITASGRDRFGRSESFDPLLHFDERVHRCRAAADESDALLSADPRRLDLVGRLDVVRVSALHASEIDELASVRRVLTADDDD